MHGIEPASADMPEVDALTVYPEIFGAKPIIRGMRISVELILSLLTQGETRETTPHRLP